MILSITGFGHDGPDGDRPGYDQIAQGEAGLMSLTGPSPDEPTKVGVPIGDLLAGMYGAYGAVAALYDRDRTGHGTVVRTSLLAAIVGVHGFQGTRWTVAGEIPRAEGNHHPSIAPYGAFECADGIVQIAVGSEGLWARFAPLVDLDVADSRYATNADRVARRTELAQHINTVFRTQPMSYWLARLADIGVPAGEVRTLDRVYEWAQTRSQGLVIDVEHPTLGPIQLPGPPLRLRRPWPDDACRAARPRPAQHCCADLAGPTGRARRPQPGQDRRHPVHRHTGPRLIASRATSRSRHGCTTTATACATGPCHPHGGALDGSTFPGVRKRSVGQHSLMPCSCERLRKPASPSSEWSAHWSTC